MILERIASDTGLSTGYLALLATTASHRYKTYEIAKANGGLRTINHPARELKLLQSWLVKNVFEKLPVHPAAFAYRRGRNILAHAIAHSSQNYMLRVDFRDFFPSITGEDISTLLRTNAKVFSPELELDAIDLQIIQNLVCRDKRLTIGAPSSPSLSNAVMFEFDSYWASRCELDIIFTRYADDVYFSTNEPNLLAGVLEELRLDLNTRTAPTLSINEKKTAFTSRKRRRMVTGLVLTSSRKVSLGRDFKRKIRSLIFRHRLDSSNAKSTTHLRGLLSYIKSVEPTFIESLERKFKADLKDLL
jgi:RNA-directed DNA polymerase